MLYSVNRRPAIDNPRLVMWGAFDGCCTLLSYIRGPETAGPYTVGLTPVFSPSPQEFFDIASLPGRLYFIQSSALDRWFVYRYGDAPGHTTYHTLTSYAFADTPEAIAVAIPSEAKGKEISEGRMSIPAPIASNELARLYPATAAAAGSERLVIRYVLPVKGPVEEALNIGIEVFKVILLPVVELLLLPATTTRRSRARFIFVGLGLLYIVAARGWVGWTAWSTGWMQSRQAILSVALASLAGLASAAKLYAKGAES